ALEGTTKRKRQSSPTRLSGLTSVALLRGQKNLRVVAFFLTPHSMNDSQPQVRQGPDRLAVAFTLGSFAPVILSGPFFLQGRLPGELVKGLSQGFDAGQPPPDRTEVAARKRHGRSTGHHLQVGGAGIASTVFTDFPKHAGSQAFTGSWQRVKDLAVRTAQK